MHRITSLLTSGIIAVSAVCGQMIPGFTASAYEAPKDIRLTIETKEIAINDIPENREVSVAVYLDNAPSFIKLSFILKKDSRTEYKFLRHVTKNPDVPNISTCDIGLGTGGTPDIVTAEIFSKPDRFISYNGCIAYVNLVLPESVSAGDFYSVELIPYNLDNYGDKIEILLENDWDALFGIESFSEFNSGGILITGAKEAVRGDVDDNGTVDSADASLVLAEYALYMTGKNTTFTSRQRDAADVNKDGAVDSSDASKILAYYADLSTGKTPSWD